MARRRPLMRLVRWTGIVTAISIIPMLGLILVAPDRLPEPVRSFRVDGLGGWTSDPGLDPTGGSHLLLTPDFQAFVAERLDDLADALHMASRTADQDRGDRIGHQDLRISARGVSLSLQDPAQAEVMRRVIDQVVGDNSLADLPGRWFRRQADIEVVQDGARFTLTLSSPLLAAWRNQMIARSIAVIRRRIDERGFPEPYIRRQGQDRILVRVQVPGLDDLRQLADLITTRAKLTFQMVRDVHSDSQRPSPAGPGLETLPSAERTRTGDPRHYYTVQRRAPLDGDCIVRAQQAFFSGTPVVNFRFDSRCARIFGDLTRQNTNRLFAIVLDGTVMSAPVIRQPILGGSGQISGSFTTASAADLALFLRAGALPAPLILTEARFVGPAPGQDAIDSGDPAAGPGVGWLIGLSLLLIVVISCFLLIQPQQKKNQEIQDHDS